MLIPFHTAAVLERVRSEWRDVWLVLHPSTKIECTWCGLIQAGHPYKNAFKQPKETHFFWLLMLLMTTNKSRETKKQSSGLKLKLVQKVINFAFLVFSRFAETVWKATFEFLSENSKSVTFELRPFVGVCHQCATRTLSSYVCVYDTTNILHIYTI